MGEREGRCLSLTFLHVTLRVGPDEYLLASRLTSRQARDVLQNPPAFLCSKSETTWMKKIISGVGQICKPPAVSGPVYCGSGRQTAIEVFRCRCPTRREKLADDLQQLEYTLIDGISKLEPEFEEANQQLETSRQRLGTMPRFRIFSSRQICFPVVGDT